MQCVKRLGQRLHSFKIQVSDHAPEGADALRLFRAPLLMTSFWCLPARRFRPQHMSLSPGRAVAPSKRVVFGSRHAALGEAPRWCAASLAFLTTWDSTEARKPYSTLLRYVRRPFRKMNGATMRAEAFAQILTGRRLTFDVKASADSDLWVSQCSLSWCKWFR